MSARNSDIGGKDDPRNPSPDTGVEAPKEDSSSGLREFALVQDNKLRESLEGKIRSARNWTMTFIGGLVSLIALLSAFGLWLGTKEAVQDALENHGITRLHEEAEAEVDEIKQLTGMAQKDATAIARLHKALDKPLLEAKVQGDDTRQRGHIVCAQTGPIPEDDQGQAYCGDVEVSAKALENCMLLVFAQTEAVGDSWTGTELVRWHNGDWQQLARARALPEPGKNARPANMLVSTRQLDKGEEIRFKVRRPPPIKGTGARSNTLILLAVPGSREKHDNTASAN